MRRLVFPVILASGLVMLGAVPASAAPAPAATAKAAAGKKVCKITDPALPELSGLVATKNGFLAVNDSSELSSQRRIFFLNDSCDVTRRVDFPTRPRDTEDMVLSPDGKKVWIADIGDNGVRANPPTNRDAISLWEMPVDGSKAPKIHRLAYPDGDAHDAEALLLNGDGTPIIVTKEISGSAKFYVPAAALKTNNETGVPLKKAGEIELPRTDTAGTAFARLAQGIVTGAAIAPGGGKVVLRTYLDAFEWDVTNGDVLAALKAKPRVTGLPNEPFGEAITYSSDGKLFYTVSDMGAEEDKDVANYILSYTPSTKVVLANADAKAEDKSSGSSWYSDLSLTDITYLVGGVGVLGAILVGAGIFGIIRSRKKPLPEPAAKSVDGTGPKPLDAQTELLAVGGPPVYGANRPAAAASGPGVYGAKPAQKGGGVYGANGRPPQGAGGAGGQAPGRPGAGQPAGRPGPNGQPAGRPAGGQPAGRPGAGQPAARPGGGRPGGGQPGGQPAGRPGAGQPAGRPGAGQPAARPGAGGQPAGRPGAGGQPAGRPGAGGQPGGRPGAGGQPAGRPASGGQPTGRPSGQPGGRPGQGGGQPTGRPAQGGQPARPGQGGGRPEGGRPGQGGGGRPGGGVYGAPPPPPTGRQGSGGQRPLGQGEAPQSRGQQPGRPDGGRMNNYANTNRNPRGGDGRL